MEIGETTSEYSEKELCQMRITKEVYGPMHNLVKPNWVSNFIYKESFYEQKKPLSDDMESQIINDEEQLLEQQSFKQQNREEESRKRVEAMLKSFNRKW